LFRRTTHAGRSSCLDSIYAAQALRYNEGIRNGGHDAILGCRSGR